MTSVCRGGIRLPLYQDAVAHAKTATIDAVHCRELTLGQWRRRPHPRLIDMLYGRNWVALVGFLGWAPWSPRRDGTHGRRRGSMTSGRWVGWYVPERFFRHA